MHQLVEAALEAAKSGDNRRAQGFLKQVLTENPNDLDGWLVLAAVLDDPEKKRHCLNRVLTLDPTHQIAREELQEMDQATFKERPAPAVVRPPEQPRQPVVQAPAEQPLPVQTPASVQTGNGSWLNKNLVFTYPIWIKILTYLAAALFWFFTIATLCAEPGAALIPGGLALLSLASIWVVSARVEVSNDGIQASHWVTGKTKLAWTEIAEFKSNATGQNLNLIAKSGKKVSVTAQVGGYAQIVEILRRKRPDLFNGSPAPQGRGISAASSFSGEKIFKRSLIGVILGYAIGIACLLFGVWGVINYQSESSNLALGGLFVFIGLYLIGNNLLSIQEVVIRPEKITIVKNFGEEELTQNQIAEIKMKTVRGRRGRVTNFVIIQRIAGGATSINGLEGGPELLYGTLMNWWQGLR